MYTGQIAFAAIGSQGVSPLGANETQDDCAPQDSGNFSVPSPGAVVIKPCSPKSIYRLAEKVCPVPLLGCMVSNRSFTQIGLTGLCDTALEDIQSKLDENNIVRELFSPFTAE